MRSAFSIYFSLFLAFSSAQALRLPFHKRAITGASVSSPFKTSFSFASLSQSQTTATQDVNDVQDVRYVTNITINGVQVPVALDTGSTDLWVIPPGGIGSFDDTKIEVSLLYGDGSYGTDGTIGVAPFEFGSYTVEKQAFVNAISSTIGLQEMGIYGLMGLSFDFDTGSPINDKIQSIYGPDATWGRSVLKNIFLQNPSEPNMIALLLARTGDLEDTDGGSFTIGEYLPQHASVVNQARLTQFPQGGDRWTVLMDGVYVDGTAVSLASNGVPSGQAQTLLDTGNANAQLPTELYDAIYSRIPGAALYNGDSGRFWVIPCNTSTNLEFVFAGVHYPIHPLDLSTISDPVTLNGQQYIACIASFQSADGLSGATSGFDVALGDSFLRNVYSIFDFGDTAADGSTSDPYIQLLSTLDPTKAISEVATIRGQTLASLPPEMPPASFVYLLTSSESSTGAAAASASLPSNDPSSADSLNSASSSGPSSDNPKSISDLSTVNGVGGGGQTASTDGTVMGKYGTVIVGLLAANLVVGLVLLSFAVLSYVKRGGLSKKNVGRRITIDPPGTQVYTPVKNIDRDEGYGFSESQVKLQANRYTA